MGPLRGAKTVSLAEDFVDARGFVFVALVAGDYTFRPVDSDGDLTQTLTRGSGPNVQNIPILCSVVRADSAKSMLVAYL